MGTEGIGEGRPLHVYGESCEGRDASCGNEGSCEGAPPRELGGEARCQLGSGGLLVCMERRVHGTVGAP